MTVARAITDFIGPGGWLTVIAINGYLAAVAHKKRKTTQRQLDNALNAARNLQHMLEERQP